MDAPALPTPTCDLVEDPEGYSAELSAERVLGVLEAQAFQSAIMDMPPVFEVDGSREVRGLVSVDDETLWVYVHAVGPGPYDAVAEVGARSLLQRLWTDVHRSASHHEAR